MTSRRMQRGGGTEGHLWKSSLLNLRRILVNIMKGQSRKDASPSTEQELKQATLYAAATGLPTRRTATSPQCGAQKR
eukprot:CAMPEP_0171657660 /NCGR_PEP_ID=MMETSP0990-20121206/42425_1 /TAXON_ID=483369 /ORGANISM="non described non described, Strain CCMP2098" /LENGTH=76 /DNA_ID=CAMNT_0012238599 /DNA_START=30 /DNA_END=260 /DNA_ORIENTATION=-